MIPYVNKEEILKRIKDKEDYAERWGGGMGLVGVFPATKNKHQIVGWYSLGEISYNTYQPWYDIYLGTKERYEFLKNMVMEVCDQYHIYCAHDQGGEE